jgi:hypothetical protein
VSNDSIDKGSPYSIGENALALFVTDARSAQFHYKSAKISIPYDSIVNVIYNDARGEELYNLIQSKKHND